MRVIGRSQPALDDDRGRDGVEHGGIAAFFPATRAFGGKTFKLVFGHRGGNQPVKEVSGKGVEITSHNHGFAVQAETLPADVEVTHINLNDQCVEGMRHRTLPVISVQYHPEAAPGPHDAEHHFQRFVELMARAQR